MTQELKNIFAPCIIPFVETVLRESRIGICSGSLRIQDIKCGDAALADGPNADRFKLVIPYAGHSLKWEVLFNACYYEDPPEFIFSDDDADFMPNIDHLKSLTHWDPDRPHALLDVLNELLEEYQKHQLSLVQNNGRLHFEYNSLIEEAQYDPKDIEVHVSKTTATKLGPINFLIKLKADFSRIPSYLIPENPGEDAAVLMVTFTSAENGRGSPQLFLAPRVEHALGGASGLRIPQFPSGGCLMDYVPEVSNLLIKKVEQIVNGHEKRKEYVTAFINKFGRSVIEYDSEGFFSISFLFEWHDFFFIFTVKLPLYFPIEQPTLNFQSIYHETQGRPYSKLVKNFPYSPRWDMNEMADRAQNFILDFIQEFQKGSVREGSI